MTEKGRKEREERLSGRRRERRENRSANRFRLRSRQRKHTRTETSSSSLSYFSQTVFHLKCKLNDLNLESQEEELKRLFLSCLVQGTVVSLARTHLTDG